MKRLALMLAPLALLAGCIVRTVPGAYRAPPMAEAPPQAPLQIWYYGEHFIPEAYGGGWCYLQGAHVHDYYPDRPDVFVLDNGYYSYRGPFVFTYYEGHPLPGGAWCYIRGPHTHDFNPPSGSEWAWRRGYGYVYQGPYRPDRPPPVQYWPRPAPAPVYRPAPAPAPATYGRPAPAPAPAYDYGRTTPAPAPAYDRGGYPAPAPRPEPYPRPAPYPQPAPEPGHSGDAPGHGNLPPGQGGIPPGQVGRPGVPTAPPPFPQPQPEPQRGGGLPPGHGGSPPGQGGVPPGQAGGFGGRGNALLDRVRGAAPAAQPQGGAPARGAPGKAQKKNDKEQKK